MAGFFGLFDFTKPGPGVPKDEPPKPRIVVFFGILQRKFWNLIRINLLFNIFNLPAMILAFIVSLYLFPRLVPADYNDPNILISDFFFRFALMTVLLCIPIITVGPAQAGFTYLMRNYAREEHAFIWGDFKEHALKNFKQSMIISAIDFVVAMFMLWSIQAYIILNGVSKLMPFGATLLIVIFIIFMIMHMYIYPMLVTFKLSIRQIYKNALLFALGNLFPNLGIVLLSIILPLLLSGELIPFSPIIGMILYAFITVSLIGLMTNFFVYPRLKKYMMKEDDVEEDAEDTEDEQE